ncbi:MAG: DUF4091 domain-containing protein [Clostridia bacterium]|nr:DUF4091 domain-containing protein [Clostridia bacterium]
MDTIFSLENESFKLRLNGDLSAHNFVPKTRKIELSACRNSTAAFQVIFQSDSPTAVNLGTQGWFSEIGDMNNIRLEHSGVLSASMNHIDIIKDDKGVYYADALLGQKVVQVKADIPHAVYVELSVPSDLPAAKYSGSIKIYTSQLFDDEELLGEAKYSLKVYEPVLPDLKDGSFYLDLWQHNSNIARKAEVELWSDRHFEIIEQYVKTLSDIGQRSITAVVSEIPWCGQRCFLDKETPANMFEYSMVTVEKQNSDFVYDFSVLDRYIELCLSYGIDKEIEVFGLLNNWQSVSDGYYNYTNYSDILRIRYRDTDGAYKYMRRVKDIEDYIKAIHSHFIEKGWIDIARVAADEPWELEIFKVNFERIRKLAPKFQYKVAMGKYEFYDNFKTTISDFAPSLCGFLNQKEKFEVAVKENKDVRFLWYICCDPDAPNTYIKSGLLEIRYVAVLTHFFGLQGLLRWSYNIWPEKPREEIRYSMYPAGDTNFVYPSGDMSPLLTLRYKALKRAIEDFELLEMLKSKGKDKAVNEAYDSVITNRDFKTFYESQENKITYDKLSSLQYSGWEKMREGLYKALNNINTESEN